MSGSGHRHVYEMNLNEIINMHKISQLIDKKGYDQFHLKIINQDTFYFITFDKSIVSKSDFKKQTK